MAVNGPATEDGVLSPTTEQVLQGSPGHDPMFVPITYVPETGEFLRPQTIIQIRPPERPL